MVESAIHTLIFRKDTFAENLFPNDPHELWMRMFIAVLFTGFGFIAQSLNDRRVRAEIARGAEQFRQVVENSPEAIGICQQGQLVLANTATLKMLGAQNPEQLVGKPILSFIHPDDIEAAKKRIEGGVNSYLVEDKLVRLDGATFLAEIAAVPIEFSGAPAVMFLARDIDERKRWEIELESSAQQTAAAKTEAETARLREQEHARLLELFYQHTHDCIVLLDKDFNFIRVNRAYANICGLDIEAFPGHNHFELYPSPLIEEFKKVVATGTPYQAYTRPFTFPDHPEWGETYWDLSLIPIRDAGGNTELLLLTLKDVTDRQRAELAWKKSSRALRTISACDSLLIHASDEAELLNGMCRMIVETNGYCMSWVGYAEQDDDKTVSPRAHAGSGAEFLEKARFSWGNNEYGCGPTGIAIRTGKPSVVHNIATAECRLWCSQALACGYSSSIALPLRDENGTFGVLSIYAHEPGVFEAEEIELLEQLAADLSFGISSLRAGVARRLAEGKIASYLQQLEGTVQGALLAVSNMVEQRDPYTAGHERRVGIISADIAREMGWDEARCRELQMIGLIHDLGKIAIPAEILSKPGRLTALEYDMVKSHVERGYEILKDVKFLQPIAEVIHQHHERIDGSGYPRGLKGDEILPEARIIAVADVLESMSSHRPYRAALGIDTALAEITSHSGTSYDTAVVDAMLRLIREKQYRLPS